jgi:hypothetical protein
MNSQAKHSYLMGVYSRSIFPFDVAWHLVSIGLASVNTTVCYVSIITHRIAVIISSCAGVSEMADEWMRTSSLSGFATEQVARAREFDRAQTLARHFCSLLHLWGSGRPVSMAPPQSGISLHNLMTLARRAATAPSPFPSVSTLTPRFGASMLCKRRAVGLQLREETGVG